jgi:F1F0 ATPase subunit 2
VLPFEFHPFSLALSLLAGLAIGFFFFGGLWWTVKYTVRSGGLSFLLPLSFAVRLTVALGAFYLAGARSWQNLLACVLGFLAARAVLARTLRLDSGAKPSLAKRASKQERKRVQ